MRGMTRGALACALAVVLCGTAWADTITLDSGSAVVSHARAHTSASDHQENTSPGSSGTLAAVSTGASSTTGWSATTGLIVVDVEHQTTGQFQSQGQSIADLRFSLTETTAYEISGAYTFGDGLPSVATESVHFTAILSQYYAPTDSYSISLFNNTQWSVAADSGTFTLGGTAGDNYNYLGGSLAGTLAAGSYRLYVQAFVHDYPGDGGGSYAAMSGDGWVELELGGSAVPEPTSLGLLGMGLGMAGLILRGRKRKLT